MQTIYKNQVLCLLCLKSTLFYDAYQKSIKKDLAPKC